MRRVSYGIPIEGGYLVYHGATGIETNVLASKLRAKQEQKEATATRTPVTEGAGNITR